MKVEQPVAFSFIMQDDIYLTNADKTAYANKAAAPAVTETPAPSFNYLGGHKKNFLVITHYQETEFMAENHLAALESTLKRLEYTMNDVAILNRHHHNNATFAELAAFFAPENLLILGQHALPPGVETLAINKLKQVADCNILYTFSFNEMMDSTENKKAFWEQMKQL